ASLWSGAAPCAAALICGISPSASRRLLQPTRLFIAITPSPLTTPNKLSPFATKLKSFMSLPLLDLHLPLDRPPAQREALAQFDDRVDRQHQRDRDHHAGEHPGRIRDLPGMFDRPSDALRRDQELTHDGGRDRARERDLEPGEEERQQRGPDD